MINFKLERLSIDLSNYCSKGCDFCYNGSSNKGSVMWQSEEVIKMAVDCSQNGVKAISLGGGEPFEYNGVFDIISKLTPHMFVSVTSNGLPLVNDTAFKSLIKNKPDKIHLTIHHPDNDSEVNESLHLLKAISKHHIKTGINMLIADDKLIEAERLTQRLYKQGYTSQNIIFVPRKFEHCPKPEQVAKVAANPYFQSASCLSGCSISYRFCSLSWDKKINFCSYSPSKVFLLEQSFEGIIKALNKIKFKTCLS